MDFWTDLYRGKQYQQTLLDKNYKGINHILVLHLNEIRLFQKFKSDFIFKDLK